MQLKKMELKAFSNSHFNGPRMLEDESVSHQCKNDGCAAIAVPGARTISMADNYLRPDTLHIHWGVKSASRVQGC